MLRRTPSNVGQQVPPGGGPGDSSGRWPRPRWSEGWEARALLVAIGILYFAAAEFAPFDEIDAWIDERLFWEPIAVAFVVLLLVVTARSNRERRRLAARHDVDLWNGASSELVPICARCKAVQDENDCWEPIEAYLAYRTPDKFTRSLCPTCIEIVG